MWTLWAALLLAQAAAPNLPFLDWGACPFETCGYREWTTKKPVAMYDTWRGDRRVIAGIPAGEKVTAITGLVITYRPGIIKLDRDVPRQGLKRGQIILTYAYRGEGFSAAWVAGRYEPEFDISFTKWPDGTGCGGEHCAATYQDLGEKMWWAQVRTPSGQTGWIEAGGANLDFGKF